MITYFTTDVPFGTATVDVPPPGAVILKLVATVAPRHHHPQQRPLRRTRQPHTERPRPGIPGAEPGTGGIDQAPGSFTPIALSTIVVAVYTGIRPGVYAHAKRPSPTTR